MFAADAGKRNVVDALLRYWPRAVDAVLDLPLPCAAIRIDPGLRFPRMRCVLLPDWAGSCGVEGGLLVPDPFVAAGDAPEWQRTDWLGAAFWYLHGVAERCHEMRYGPVHSYSSRLNGWDSRVWERAWVNRIALFLRRWAARRRGKDEHALFGAPPKAQIVVTHDVDAVCKTFAIRWKQSAFQVYNALSSMRAGKLAAAGKRLSHGAAFLLGTADYCHFEEIAALEERHGLRSQFFVYGGPGGWRRSPTQLLFDPAYDVATEPGLRGTLRRLAAGGWQIGLHQSYHAWQHASSMRREKEHVEAAIGAGVSSCRQHWLRFSWEKTWRAQQEAGFELDATLGFNDRAGFRNGAALKFRPWDVPTQRPLTIAAMPMVLMDSHLYDYSDLTDAQRAQQMRYWIDEVRCVGGEATVIWHQHTMAHDYGWKSGFETFLEILSDTDLR
jgi:hypothetical protein